MNGLKKLLTIAMVQLYLTAKYLQEYMISQIPGHLVAIQAPFLSSIPTHGKLPYAQMEVVHRANGTAEHKKKLQNTEAFLETRGIGKEKN